MEANIESICEKLKIVAQICGGYVAITDKDGVRLKVYSPAGMEITELEGTVFNLAKDAVREGKIMVGKSAIDENADAWAIPLGDYVLAFGNSEKYERDRRLMQSMVEALPLIARTAGGEAVIFDAEGRRIKTVDPLGHTSAEAEGYISEAAKESMKNRKPNISPSNSIHGATAVRIPITEEFGLGFNNELRVKSVKTLVDEVKKHREAKYDLDDIIGESAIITKLKETCAFIAKSNSSVLIYGETGTGKELFAQSIHNQSNRRQKPFIAINCGAIPSSVIESYLFGYTGGSFTGAKKEGSAGAFEQANGGTIFLDEISEMDYEMQAKLLRVLQEREVNRIGSFKPIKIDVRVISSTNKDLVEYMNSGKMRTDLYFRLNVLEIEIPPLRDRPEDVPVLVSHFIKKFDILMGKYETSISQEALDALSSYDWPGNVRELQNCMERAINMLRIGERTIYPSHLPVYILSKKDDFLDYKYGAKTMSLEQHVAETEKKVILLALKKTSGSKKKAASLLGISEVTLWRKMKDYNLEK